MDTATANKMEQLKNENKLLQATIEGLQYENRMYKQLLDNLFLGPAASNTATATAENPSRIAQQEYYSNDSTTTKSVDQVQTVEIEQGINVMGLENDWEECENYEDEVKGNQKTKIKLELTEEEIIPQVENPELILSEMTKLFGEKGAQEILAMETEMQLNFEKIKDSTSAKLWPCLPLNMKFDF